MCIRDRIKAGNHTVSDKGFTVVTENIGGVPRQAVVAELPGGISDEALAAFCACLLYTSSSAWLFNAILNKHADAMDNYPEPVVLPRERSDEESAKVLSSCLLYTSATTPKSWPSAPSTGRRGTGCTSCWWRYSGSSQSTGCP